MKHQRLAYVVVMCLFGTVLGCSHPAGAPTPIVPPAPRDAFEKPDNEYFYFLAAQGERRVGKTDKAILLLRKAIEIDPESAYLRRELATVYLQNKEEDKALGALSDLLAGHPDDIKALILYGGVQQLKKNSAEAIRTYEKVIRLDPSQEKIYTLLGGLYLEQKDTVNAEQTMSRLIAKFPNSFAGHFLLGRIYLTSGRTALAEKAFRRSAELDTESIEPLFELLNIARDQGRREDILRLDREILERDPDNSRAYLDLAIYYRQAHMASESEEILRRLGERSKTEFEVILQIVQAYVDPKKFDDALYLINGMLKASPESPDLHHLKGFTLFGLKKNAEALPEFRQVTPQSRFYTDAVVHSAFILQEQGKTGEAIEIIQSVIQKNPENAELTYYLASIYEEAGDLAQAENHLKQALEKDRDNSRFLFRLGIIYDKQKNKEASMEAMRRVIALDPANASALNYLGYTLADLGQSLDEAEQLVLEALKHKPDDGYITDSLGWVYYKKGEYEKALKYLQKASELVPEDPVIMEHVGDAYLKLNDRANALKHFQKAMAKREKEKDRDPEKLKEKKELQDKIRQLKEGSR
jgi:tetratricopeptide (TPR) repeat protein